MNSDSFAGRQATSAVRRWAVGLAALGALGVVARFVVAPAVARRTMASRDRAATETILRRFPRLPAAKEVHRFLETIHKSEDSDVVTGYTLSVEYRLPPDATPGQVFSYYSGRLPDGWRPASNADCPPFVAPEPPPGWAPRPTLAQPGTRLPEFLERPATHRDFLAEGQRASVSLDLSRRGDSTVMLEVTVDPHGRLLCTSGSDGGPDPSASGFR